MKTKKAQTVAEYAIVASIIAIVFATMGVPFKRSIQRVVKSVSDELGFQADAEQASNLEKGFLNRQETNIATTSGLSSKATNEFLNSWTTETTHTDTNAFTNLGITEGH